MQEKVKQFYFTIQGMYFGAPVRLENSLLLVSIDSRNKHYFEDHIEIVKWLFMYLQCYGGWKKYYK